MSQESSEAQKLPGMRNIYLLGGVSFFTDVSSEMCFSLLPVFVVKELGASRAILGLIECFAEALGYVLRLVSGAISDRFRRRKPFVGIGYAVSAFSKPFFALSTHWLHVFVVRSIDRVGKGVRTAPRDALIKESVEESTLGKAYGFHRLMDQMGAILGPIAAFLLVAFIGIRGVFLSSLIPGLLAIVFLFPVIEARSTWGGEGFSPIKGLRNAPRRLLYLLFVLGVFAAGAYNFSFILLLASESGLADQLIPLVYALINVMYVIMTVPSGLLADKVGGERVMLSAFAFFATASALASLAVLNPALALVVAVFYGAYRGVFETISRTLVARYAPEELTATVFGVYYLEVGALFFLANLVVGWLWDVVGLTWAFAYSASLSIAALLMLLPLSIRSRAGL